MMSLLNIFVRRFRVFTTPEVETKSHQGNPLAVSNFYSLGQAVTWPRQPSFDIHFKFSSFESLITTSWSFNSYPGKPSIFLSPSEYRQVYQSNTSVWTPWTASAESTAFKFWVATAASIASFHAHFSGLAIFSAQMGFQLFVLYPALHFESREILALDIWSRRAKHSNTNKADGSAKNHTNHNG